MYFNKGFVIIFIIIVLLYFAVLELSKNTLVGWGLALALFAGFFILHGKYLHTLPALARIGSWVVFIFLIAVVVRLTAPPERRIPAVSSKNPEAAPVRTVSEGALSGVYNADSSVEVYAGIPYAAPPVGELRWREPQPPAKWEGVRVCDHFAPMSMQPRDSVLYDSIAHIIGYHDFRISLNDNWIEAMSEDSLYLNIWKPAGEVESAPVIVYIHGGSLTNGQSSQSIYNGETLAAKGAVFVTIAYRLNVFGYFADESLASESPNGTTGNYGLLDQIAALKWIKANIHAFGGDPENITIAGESAGSSSVNALCCSPLAKGLFRRAIAESSGITPKKPYHTFRSLDAAFAVGKRILAEFGATSAAELRSVPAKKLLRTRHKNNALTVDGYALTEQPWLTYMRGANHEEALLHGFNSHEADPFVFMTRVAKANYEAALSETYGSFAAEAARLMPPYPQNRQYKYFFDLGGDAKGAYNALISAAWFGYSHFDWSRLMLAEGRPVYEYYFNKDNGRIGAIHSGEIPYFYGNLTTDTRLYSEDDHALSAIMQGYILNFASTGDPNGGSLPDWPQLDDEHILLEFSSGVHTVQDPFLAVYELIDRYQNEADGE